MQRHQRKLPSYLWILSAKFQNKSFTIFLEKKSLDTTASIKPIQILNRASSRKRSYYPRSQINRQMPRVGLMLVGRCGLSIGKLGHTYQLSHLSTHHLLGDSHRKAPTKQHFYNEGKNKQIIPQIKIHWKILLKLKNTRKLKYKLSEIKHTTDERKNTIKYTCRLKYITSTWWISLKWTNTKKM